MIETELKFQVPPERAARLERAVATATAQTTRLQAVYAETADRRLAAHAMALRLRKEGRVWVQTLKGRGDGLMNRLEHEVPLPPAASKGGVIPVLDVQRHAGTAVGDRLIALLNGERLQPLYTTDIRRLHRVVRSRGLRVEVAYDRGWLVAGEGAQRRRLAVNEIEFELLEGSPSAFVAFAAAWTARHGLWWDCRTKSERGMRLALDRPRVPATLAVPATRSPRLAALARSRQRVVAALAHALPNAAEIASGLDAAEHGQQLVLAMRALRAALQQGVDAAPGTPAVTTAQALLDAAGLASPRPPDAEAICGPAFQQLLLGCLGWALASDGA